MLFICRLGIIGLFLSLSMLSKASSHLQSQYSQSEQASISLESAWHLTSKDIAHYHSLMQGQAGSWYKDLPLSPVDILGMYAETKADKIRFAELAAKLQFEKISREMAYNQAVQAALERLYPNVSPVQSFDTARFSDDNHHMNLNEGRHVLLTSPITLLQKAVSQSLIHQLQNSALAGLDIYFIHADANAIQRWSSIHQLPKQLVDSGKITLNFATPDWIENAKKGLPQWFAVKEGQLHAITFSR